MENRRGIEECSQRFVGNLGDVTSVVRELPCALCLLHLQADSPEVRETVPLQVCRSFPFQPFHGQFVEYRRIKSNVLFSRNVESMGQLIKPGFRYPGGSIIYKMQYSECNLDKHGSYRQVDRTKLWPKVVWWVGAIGYDRLPKRRQSLVPLIPITPGILFHRDLLDRDSI